MADRPKVVLGLGNPGSRYRETRHNLGVRVVERLAGAGGVQFAPATEVGRSAWMAETRLGAAVVVLAVPRTYMNRSGQAAVALCRSLCVAAEELLVVYDDADLELGRIRLRPQGGPGGHNGVASLIEQLETDRFPRLRLGVRGAGRSEGELADYVLAPFDPAERSVAEEMVSLAAEAVGAVVTEGLARAMNSYNARSVAPSDSAERSEEEG